MVVQAARRTSAAGGPSERDRGDLRRAGLPQGGRAGGDGGAGRDDVVDDQRRGRHPGARLDRAGRTGEAGTARAPDLRRARSPAAETVRDGKAGGAGDRVGQNGGLVEAAPPLPDRVERDRDEVAAEQLRRRGRDDEGGHLAGERESPAELERPDKIASGALVGDGRPDADSAEDDWLAREEGDPAPAGGAKRHAPLRGCSARPAKRGSEKRGHQGVPLAKRPNA